MKNLRPRARVLVAALVVAAPLCLYAQDTSTAAPATPNTIDAVVFHTPDPYTSAELLPIAAIAPGSISTPVLLQQATQRLADTGVFATVFAAYSNDGRKGTVTFELKSVPLDELPRASFANFVWLTRAEIQAALQPVPLYRGYIPDAGNGHIAVAVQAALQQALAAKGVTATLAHAAVPASKDHPYPAVEFRVTSPNVVLESATVSGGPGSLVDAQLKAQAKALKIPYNDGIAGTTIQDVLLAPARNAGYAGARLEHGLHTHRTVGDTVYVTYMARMETGPVYTIKNILWTPTPVYGVAEFSRETPLRIGAPPSADSVALAEKPILAAYHAQGYTEAVVKETSTLDPDSGAVTYAFTVDPGPQYTLHAVTVNGLSPEAQAEFDSAWTLKPGDVFNEKLLVNFLIDHQSLKTLAGYSLSYNTSSTPDTHLVDLTLNFKPSK